MERKRVYIAGPYSHGDVAVNVANAMRAGTLVLNMGHSPFVPHLNHYMHMFEPQSYRTWIELDLHWVETCDVLWRLPGYSPGADQEEAHAYKCGIPVADSESMLRGILNNGA